MIPILLILGFLGLLLLINRRRLGVKGFNDYATASRSFGVMGITFGVLASWYVGAGYTAWAGFAVSFGAIAFYVVPYAMMTLVVMYLVADKTFIWGKKYNIETQSELLGLRYRSDGIRVLTAVAGVVLSVPWLLMEWWTTGFVISYATGSAIDPFWGMALGVIVVVAYVALGGMRSVITANILQGVYMVVLGSALMIWMLIRHFGGLGAAMSLLAENFGPVLTYPGPGWSPPTPYWTSIVIASGLGGFMWPWVYNKLFAADSLRTIKRAVLLAPTLGVLYYSLLVLLGITLHNFEFARANPQEAFLWIHAQTGPWALGLFAVLVIAASIGTVSSILNAMSTAISNDIALVIRRSISNDVALKIARVSVIVLGFAALIGAYIQQGLLIFLALLTYQGMIMLFPVVILGLYWKRANKQGAVIGFLAGTGLSFTLTILAPGYIDAWGWSPGMYGVALTVAIMLVAGWLRPVEPHVHELWKDIETARAAARARRRASRRPAPAQGVATRPLA